MSSSLVTVAYLASAVLFILALGGLSTNDTARRGNLFGIIGMVIAVAVTIAAFVTGTVIGCNGAACRTLATAAATISLAL